METRFRFECYLGALDLSPYCELLDYSAASQAYYLKIDAPIAIQSELTDLLKVKRENYPFYLQTPYGVGFRRLEGTTHIRWSFYQGDFCLLLSSAYTFRWVGERSFVTMNDLRWVYPIYLQDTLRWRDDA